MTQETLHEFDFDAGAQDYGYDPLADVMTEEDEEEEKLGEFTGTPIASLAGTAATAEPAEPEPQVPAAERIEKLFEKFNPRRRVMAGILRFVDTPQSTADLNKKVEELQKHDFSVYTAANYAELLEEAGAVVKTTAEGVPFAEAVENEPLVVEVEGVSFLKPAPWREVYWTATQDARDYLAKDDPMARFAELIDRDVQYIDIYLRILDKAAQEGGATTPELNAIVDDDPLVQSPRLYTAHFTELLERCEALRWEGTWKITEIGQALLDGTIQAPATTAESEA